MDLPNNAFPLLGATWETAASVPESLAEEPAAWLQAGDRFRSVLFFGKPLMRRFESEYWDFEFVSNCEFRISCLVPLLIYLSDTSASSPARKHRVAPSPEPALPGTWD